MYYALLQEEGVIPKKLFILLCLHFTYFVHISTYCTHSQCLPWWTSKHSHCVRSG